MKNILLFGVARSGKSTLAKKILKEYPNYKIMDLDSLLDTFSKTLPEANVGYLYDKVKENRIAKFTGCLLNEQVSRYGRDSIYYIIEGDSILPEDIKENFDLENTIVIFLGHNKLTPEEILNNCRKYDSNTEWTSRWKDNKLIKHAKWQLKIGKKIEKQCQKYNYMFVDTSKNRNKILKQTYAQIEKELAS